ncbi:hypothetical protein [Halorussus salinisoli]|uniref:hypothetical protein n=1 Tax=Halorussus salinisoli TaxID=2558242 RepID=UPI0010C22DE3|nr:hypothetical protein [Halorussus salinisoli]
MAKEDEVAGEGEDVEEEAVEPEESTDSQAVKPEEFETLDLTLEEARRRYENEEQRRDAVESKIGTVVTVDALIISFGGLFSDLNSLLVLAVLLPAILSAGIGLFGIRSQKYGKPGLDIEDFHEYSKMGETEQKEHFLLAYEVATGDNEDLNSTKFKVFNYCVGYTFLSLVLVLLSPLAQQFGLPGVLADLPPESLCWVVGVALAVLVLGPPMFVWIAGKLAAVMSDPDD